MQLVLAGLLIVGLVGVMLGTGAVIYRMLDAFDISISFWTSLGLIVVVWSLTPYRKSVAQLAELITRPPGELSLLSIAENKELTGVLTKLAALLLLLALMAWVMGVFPPANKFAG